MTELERMDAQHAAKWKNQHSWQRGIQFKEALRNAELILEQQISSKAARFDFEDRHKNQEMTKAFQKSNLQGRLSLLPLILADLATFAQNFEPTKAAKVCRCALLTLPSTVATAF